MKAERHLRRLECLRIKDEKVLQMCQSRTLSKRLQNRAKDKKQKCIGGFR